MNHRYHSLTAIALALMSTSGMINTVSAQVAGGTTSMETTITESTKLAMGWSVKKTLLGKTIYSDTGAKIGKVEDLIISPDKSVSYVIVGAGGFIGIGRHDVAIAVNQIQDVSGKLVMAGATKEMIKGMPQFAYSTDTSKRDAFVAAADRDIAKGRAAVAGLEKKANEATAEAKVKINSDIAALQSDVKSAEGKLTDMKHATSVRWKEFESDVNAAIARLRKSTDKATG